MSDVEPAAVPTDLLEDGNWKQTDRTVETLSVLPTGGRVEGHTLVYEQPSLGSAAPAPEQCSRFFFATRLSFEPGLAPGTERVVKPIVVSNAGESFADRLRDRGFTEVSRKRKERLRMDTGDRATVVAYHATLPDEDEEIPIEGWLAVWVHDGFRIAGGAYPRQCELLPDDVDPDAFREELVALLRATE